MAGAIKTLPTLTDRAEAVAGEVQAALGGMAAYVLPVEVRTTIQKMAHLVEDMAREIEKGKA